MKLRNPFRRKRQDSYTRETPRTGGYEPVSHFWWNQPRDLPPFGFGTIRAMLYDGMVRLCLAMRAAPIHGVEFAYRDGDEWIPGVKADNPEVAAFVQRQLERIWQNHLPEILKAQVWGWSAGEITLRLTRDDQVEIDRLESRQAMDTRVLLEGGQAVGIRVDRVKPEGFVDLTYPRCWFHKHEPESGEHYGRSILLGAYSPWADKNMNGGAMDVRRLFMHKDAYGGAMIGYPDEDLVINGVEVPARDVARQIVEQKTAGGVMTYPLIYDANGNKKWEIEQATVASNPQHILQYPKDLDAEIRRGCSIPDDLIDSEGAGGWAGKRVPMSAFYASLDAWVTEIVNDFTEQVFEHLVMLNFGKAEDFEITHKPLAEQAMEQQANAGPGQGAGQPPSPPAGGGFMQQPQNANPNPQTLRMSLDPVDAVGRGVLDAANIVEAARNVLRMSNEDKSKGFWRTGDDGQRVFIDPDGEVRAGGPGGKVIGESTKNDSRETEKKSAEPKSKEAITKQEADAVTAYSTRKFQEINSDLRSGKTSKNSATIKQLDSAIRKSRTTEDQQLFRAAKIPAIEEAMKSGNIEGLEFSDEAYTSTSKAKDKANNFARDGARMFKVNVPKGSSALDVGENAGGLKGEQEVLLPRGAKFRVKGVQKVKEKVAFRDLKGKTKHRMQTVEYVEIDLIDGDSDA